MQNKWMQRLTLGLAATALFVAAGGPTYAASKINGKNIKTRSVAGTKLKNNTITGTQVNESKLGTVPRAIDANRALSADVAKSADKAKDADTVDGVSEENFTRSEVLTDSSCPISNVAATDCNGVTINLPRRARVKLDFYSGWFSTDGAGTTVGATCEIQQDGATLSSGFTPGTTSNDTDVTHTRSFAVGSVTTVVQNPGNHTYNLQCQANAGDDFTIVDLRSVATMVGSS